MLNQRFKLKKETSVFFWFTPLFIFFTAFLTQGYCEDVPQQNNHCYFVRPLIEVKAGYFFFSDSKMRKVYDHGGWDVQLSTSYPLCNLVGRENLNAYAAVEYLHCSGQSLQDDQKTFLSAIPVNIGLKPVITISPAIQYYFALGPRYFYIHQHNDSSYVDRNKSRNGVGLFVNTGFNFILCHHFLIDIFGEYSYAKTRFHSEKVGVYTRDIQVGGFTFGGGLGYAF